METSDNLKILFMTPCASMAKSSYSSESLEEIVQEENIVDYGSDTVAPGGEDPDPNISASRGPSLIAPNPFTE